MLVISEKDYYDKIDSYKGVTSIEEALLFEPNKNYKTIVGKKIGFYYGKKSYEYTIENFYETEIPGILISNNSFETMKENKNSYTYLIKFDSKKTSNIIEQRLKRLDKNIIVLNRQRYYVEDDNMSSGKLMDLIYTLKFISIIITLIFGFIFVITIKNIIKDRKKLGYSNR